MSKIQQAADELWLPPHLRREPSTPPTGRRFFSNRRQCCKCQNKEMCFDGNWSGTYVATVAGMANDQCSSCATWNTSFTLPPGPVSPSNRTADWIYYEDPGFCERDPYEPTVIFVWLNVSCFAGVCGLFGSLEITDWIDPGFGSPTYGDWREIHSFRKLLPSGGNCMSTRRFQGGQSYELAWYSRSCQEWGDDGMGGDDWISCPDPVTYRCDASSATFTMDFNAP